MKPRKDKRTYAPERLAVRLILDELIKQDRSVIMLAEVTGLAVVTVRHWINILHTPLRESGKLIRITSWSRSAESRGTLTPHYGWCGESSPAMRKDANRPPPLWGKEDERLRCRRNRERERLRRQQLVMEGKAEYYKHPKNHRTAWRMLPATKEPSDG